MDEPTKKSLTQQALESLPKNELRASVTTDDGKAVDGKIGVHRSWDNGVTFGFFVDGKFQVGQKPKGAVGLEISKKFGK